MTTADAIEYFERQKICLASINLPGLESCEKALEALRLMQEIEQMKPLVIEAKQTAELDQMMREIQKQKPTICVDNGVTFATDTKVGDKWTPTAERLPDDFVSVLGHMTDAGEFPAVRECYVVGTEFFFPALRECHPVDKWMTMPE